MYMPVFLINFACISYKMLPVFLINVAKYKLQKCKIQKKMLESRPEDALVKLVELVNLVKLVKHVKHVVLYQLY